MLSTYPNQSYHLDAQKHSATSLNPSHQIGWSPRHQIHFTWLVKSCENPVSLDCKDSYQWHPIAAVREVSLMKKQTSKRQITSTACHAHIFLRKGWMFSCCFRISITVVLLVKPRFTAWKCLALPRTWQFTIWNPCATEFLDQQRFSWAPNRFGDVGGLGT